MTVFYLIIDGDWSVFCHLTVKKKKASLTRRGPLACAGTDKGIRCPYPWVSLCLHLGSRRVQTARCGACLTDLLAEFHSALRAGTCTPFRLTCVPFEAHTAAMVTLCICPDYGNFPGLPPGLLFPVSIVYRFFPHPALFAICIIWFALYFGQVLFYQSCPAVPGKL